jgi:hypothetical protein
MIQLAPGGRPWAISSAWSRELASSTSRPVILPSFQSMTTIAWTPGGARGGDGDAGFDGDLVGVGFHGDLGGLAGVRPGDEAKPGMPDGDGHQVRPEFYKG